MQRKQELVPKQTAKHAAYRDVVEVSVFVAVGGGGGDGEGGVCTCTWTMRARCFLGGGHTQVCPHLDCASILSHSLASSMRNGTAASAALSSTSTTLICRDHQQPMWHDSITHQHKLDGGKRMLTVIRDW